jgi:hypothetical protein
LGYEKEIVHLQDFGVVNDYELDQKGKVGAECTVSGLLYTNEIVQVSKVEDGMTSNMECSWEYIE